ncbi:unnamed protein product [Meganyctiphanes norvegica]|uniref:Ig-like domain-containing protein n=1 Tax=Meganyctiphanes norvegica TaxID=48144 RepID=A0AAV2PVD3_MEGNR
MWLKTWALCLLLLGLVGLCWSQRVAGGGRGREAMPNVVTQPQTFHVHAGEAVTLPCRINNIGRRSVFWFKGDNSEEGRELIMQLKSYRGTFTIPRQYQRRYIDTGKLQIDGTDLTIVSAVKEDTSTYTCSVAFARQSVSHRLEVEELETEEYVDYELKPVEIDPVPVNGILTIAQGSPATFTCYARGYPEPTVTWYKEDGADRVLGTGNSYTISSPTRDDSGNYYCTADNGDGYPQTSHFNLYVEYLEVAVLEKEVMVSDDLHATISCRVDGNPTPEVLWYKNRNSEIVRPDDDYLLRYKDGNLYTLRFIRVEKSDLSDYTCYAYNSNLQQSDQAYLKADPKPVTTYSFTKGSDYWPENTYNASFVVPDQLKEIKYFTIEYRLADQSPPLEWVNGGESDLLYWENQKYFNLYDLVAYQDYEVRVDTTFTDDTSILGAVTRFTTGEIDKKVDAIDEDETPWWKYTMTMISRLPQLARVLQ